MQDITISGKLIAKSSPAFLIAEAGVNHNGDMNLAKKLISIAAESGVDAVKFQAFKTEKLILSNIEKAPYQKNTTSKTESQYEMLKKLEVSKEDNIELIKFATKRGIIFLSTPFDDDSLDMLDELGVPAFKVASTDITNLPFLKKVAKKNKPVILSTGMAYMNEVEMAVAEILRYNKQLIVLHCTANYPIKDNEANLRVINTYQNKFDVLIGYSDHSVGVGASPYAIPMGACLLEKHFTIDKAMKGPDHLASLSPEELTDFVNQVRKIEEYMGSSIKEPTDSEAGTRKALLKNLVAKRKINKGERFTEENLTAKRTGTFGK